MSGVMALKEADKARVAYRAARSPVKAPGE